jgi:tetratricopeptide (TPR) repeat protein
VRQAARAGLYLARVGACLLLAVACGTPERGDPRGEAWSRHRQDGLGAFQQGRYSEAAACWQQALGIARSFPEQDPRLHRTLEELADLLVVQGQLAGAESLYVRLLALQQGGAKPDGQAIAGSLAKLADLYRAQRQFPRAESLYVHLLVSYQDHPEFGSPGMAAALAKLADLYRAQGQFARADSLDRRTMGLKLHAQGRAYFLQGSDRKAETCYRQALQIQERNLGRGHPDLARTCVDWARLCQLRGDREQAERLYRRALAIQESAPALAAGDLPGTLEQLAELCGKAGRAAEAAALAARAAALRGR